MFYCMSAVPSTDYLLASPPSLFSLFFSSFFFFNDTATTEIYTLSLHDALPIYKDQIMYLKSIFFRYDNIGVYLFNSIALNVFAVGTVDYFKTFRNCFLLAIIIISRSEEHTSELQSRLHLVCRLLLEKKKKTIKTKKQKKTIIMSKKLICIGHEPSSSIHNEYRYVTRYTVLNEINK